MESYIYVFTISHGIKPTHFFFSNFPRWCHWVTLGWPLSHLRLGTLGILSYSLIPQSMPFSTLLFLLQPQKCLLLLSCSFSWRLMFNIFKIRDIRCYICFVSKWSLHPGAFHRQAQEICMHAHEYISTFCMDSSCSLQYECKSALYISM